MQKFREVISCISLFLVEIPNLIMLIIGTGSGGGAVIMLNQPEPLSIVWPISLFALSAISIGYFVFRSILKWKRWEKAQDNHTLLTILDELQELHFKMGDMAKPLRGICVNQITLSRLSYIFGKSLGLDGNDYKKMKGEILAKAWLGIEKKLKRIYKYNLKDFMSFTEILVEMGHALDKHHIGITKIRENNLDYDSLYRKLKKDQLKLNFQNPDTTYWIDKAIDFSFGLHSIALAFHHYSQDHQFVSVTPHEKLIVMKRTIEHIDATYTIALANVKQRITRDLWKGMQ